MKDKLKNLDFHKWVVLAIIIIFVLVGSLTNLIPGVKNTPFATVINGSIGKFFDVVSLVKNHYVHILESIAIILFMGILFYVVSTIIKLFTRKNNRSETIGTLVNSIARFAIMIITLILVLAAWDVPSGALAAGAGIVGLAVSFGTQGLLEDVFAGLSIIFEKQFVVGNFVEIDDFRGEVMEIGPRNTRIKDIYGNVLIIANSDIREIINLSDDLSYAISEISVEYSADINKVEEVIKSNLKKIAEKIPAIVAGPIYDGVDQLADSAIVIRVIAHCEEKDRLNVRRALNKELKVLFDENNINIPFPQLVLHKADKE